MYFEGAIFVFDIVLILLCICKYEACKILSNFSELNNLEPIQSNVQTKLHRRLGSRNSRQDQINSQSIQFQELP